MTCVLSATPAVTRNARALNPTADSNLRHNGRAGAFHRGSRGESMTLGLQVSGGMRNRVTQNGSYGVLRHVCQNDTRRTPYHVCQNDTHGPRYRVGQKDLPGKAYHVGQKDSLGKPYHVGQKDSLGEAQ